MANGRIKGITIELNGDVTKLNKALSSSEKAAQTSARALKEIEKNLKFNPGNTKLVEQQQRNLGEAINATKEKLKVLREADGQMKQQLNEGKISVDQYEAFQREIISTEGQLQNYEKRLASSQSEQEKLENATQNLSTIFEASGAKIDDFADILGEDTVEAFKKGEGSSEQMEAALQKLGDELLGTRGDSEKLSEDLERLGEGVSFETLQEEAKASGAQFGQLGDKAGEAREEIEKVDKDPVTIAGLDAAIDLFGKLKDAVGDALSSIMDAWGKIDDGQDTIIAKTGATGKAAEEMGDIFTNVYTSMPSEAQSVGDAIGELNTQFGLQGDSLEEATKKLLKYSEINGSDVTSATQSAKGAMDQFGLSAEDLGSVLDTVTKAGQDTGVQTEKLLDSIAQGAPTLQGLGLSFEESAVMMSRFEQSGIDGSKALTYLTKAQSVAAKDGKTLNEALAEFNEVANSSASETEKINKASELFGTKGGAMMLKAAQDGNLDFTKLKEAVAEAGGTIETTYDNMLDPVDNVTVAQHNLDAILGDIGTTIQQAAAPAIDALVGFLSMLRDGFSSLSPEVKTAVVVIAGIVTGFLGVVAAIATLQTAFSMLGPIIANMTGIFTSIGSAMSGIFSFVAANPIVLIIAAIVAAVALLITHWDTVKVVAQEVWDKIVEVWNGILAFIGPIIEAIGLVISSAWEGIKNVVTSVINAISNVISSVFNAIKSVVTTIWNGIKTFITGIWNSIKTIITTAINIVKTTVSNVFNGVKGIVSDIWNGIKSTIDGVWNGIKIGVSSAINAIKDNVSSVFNGIKDTATSVWNGIKSAIEGPINKAKDIVRAAIDKIKGFFNFKFTWPKIPLPHFSFSGSLNPFSGNFPPKIGLKWYKQGGIFDRPSIIGVGEAGSEAVVPTNKLDKFFADALNRINPNMGSTQGTQPININISNMTVRDQGDIERIARELQSLISRRERRV